MQGTSICFKKGCTASGDDETYPAFRLAEIPSSLERQVPCSISMQNRNVTQLPTDQK